MTKEKQIPITQALLDKFQENIYPPIEGNGSKLPTNSLDQLDHFSYLINIANIATSGESSVFSSQKIEIKVREDIDKATLAKVAEEVGHYSSGITAVGNGILKLGALPIKGITLNGLIEKLGTIEKVLDGEKLNEDEKKILGEIKKVCSAFMHVNPKEQGITKNKK